MIWIQLLSAPYKGKELEYPEDANPEKVFTGLVLHKIEWKTILPIDMDSELQEKWLLAEKLIREASEIVSRELSEEDLPDFLPEWTIFSSN